VTRAQKVAHHVQMFIYGSGIGFTGALLIVASTIPVVQI
jgi:hypothetical protein